MLFGVLVDLRRLLLPRFKFVVVAADADEGHCELHDRNDRGYGRACDVKYGGSRWSRVQVTEIAAR